MLFESCDFWILNIDMSFGLLCFLFSFEPRCISSNEVDICCIYFSISDPRLQLTVRSLGGTVSFLLRRHTDGWCDTKILQ